jgi:hypothetical protein
VDLIWRFEDNKVVSYEQFHDWKGWPPGGVARAPVGAGLPR